MEWLDPWAYVIRKSKEWKQHQTWSRAVLRKYCQGSALSLHLSILSWLALLLQRVLSIWWPFDPLASHCLETRQPPSKPEHVFLKILARKVPARMVVCPAETTFSTSAKPCGQDWATSILLLRLVAQSECHLHRMGKVSDHREVNRHQMKGRRGRIEGGQKWQTFTISNKASWISGPMRWSAHKEEKDHVQMSSEDTATVQVVLKSQRTHFFTCV